MHSQLMLIAGIALLVSAACDGAASDVNQYIHTEHISKSEFSGTWPISPTSGTLACDGTKGDAITFSPDDSTDIYAVNGSAMGWESKEGWKDFRVIWLLDNTGVGPNVNSSDFDAEGHKICDGHGTFEQ